MLKRIMVLLFVLAGLFSVGQYDVAQFYPQKVYASGGEPVYLDDDCNVTVLKVYKKSAENIDTDVEFIFFKSFTSSTTHYEFQKREGTWLFRTHLLEYGPWAPVSRDKIAQAIFDYAYYNS